MTEDNTIASEDMSRQSTGTTLLDRRGSNGMVIAPLHKTQSVALALPSPSDTYQPGKLTFPDANGRLQPNYFDTPKRSRRLQSPYNTVGLPRTLTQDRTNPEDMNEATSIDLEDHLGEEERLTDRQRHMAQLLRDSKDTTSYFSVIYFIGACVGKLVLVRSAPTIGGTTLRWSAGLRRFPGRQGRLFDAERQCAACHGHRPRRSRLRWYRTLIRPRTIALG
jgi:hypothetical protein